MTDSAVAAQATLTFGSLFSGIGGIDLGLERAGMRCLWQVENEPWATDVLAHHWPDVTRYDDVKEVHGAFFDGGEASEAAEGRLAPVDLICGGFPCQDISSAGRRAGLEGEHSGLWVEFARIVREARPRYVLVENSTSLLVRGMGDVLGDLAAIGYDAEWDCLPAAAFGAPHLRARLWILAYSRGDGGEAIGDSTVFAGRPLAEFRARWAPEPDVVRVVDGLSRGLDYLRGLGNAAVPAVVEWIGCRLLEAIGLLPVSKAVSDTATTSLADRAATDAIGAERAG